MFVPEFSFGDKLNGIIYFGRKQRQNKILKTTVKTMVALLISGCSGSPAPKDVKQNLHAYEKLVHLIQSGYPIGKHIQTSELEIEPKKLAEDLKIESIHYDSIETMIRMCGPGNMFTGDSCVTYNYGIKELEIENYKNSGFERVQIFGKWYKEFIYFD
jgi:hypothetical protein